MRYDRNDRKNSTTIKGFAVGGAGRACGSAFVPATLLIELTVAARTDPSGRLKCLPLDCRRLRNLLIIKSDVLPHDIPGALVKQSSKKQEPEQAEGDCNARGAG
jgi:hypothetical protein